MNDEQPIKIEVDGITFLSTGRYYNGINNWVCHKLKETDDKEVLMYASRKMASLLSSGSNIVIVPIPNHHGYADHTLALANAISQQSGYPVADILQGKDRDSNYHAKYAGLPLTETDMGFHLTHPLPSHCTPILIDNVVDTGTTAKAAFHALGNRGTILSFAMSDTLLNRGEIFRTEICR